MTMTKIILQIHRRSTPARRRSARSPTLCIHTSLKSTYFTSDSTSLAIRHLHKHPRPYPPNTLLLPNMQPSSARLHHALHSSRDLLLLLHILPRRARASGTIHAAKLRLRLRHDAHFQPHTMQLTDECRDGHERQCPR